MKTTKGEDTFLRVFSPFQLVSCGLFMLSPRIFYFVTSTEAERSFDFLLVIPSAVEESQQKNESRPRATRGGGYFFTRPIFPKDNRTSNRARKIGSRSRKPSVRIPLFPNGQSWTDRNKPIRLKLFAYTVFQAAIPLSFVR